MTQVMKKIYGIYFVRFVTLVQCWYSFVKFHIFLFLLMHRTSF